ncbi:MAG TPA: DUF3488 and transglutaminase-like domain-containing protein [Candidatus Hydrogenedentes bacterium]|nr:DUF3488 and transglutaminase-like domain-containing protein [Candidatus Hydrogenedentota bacterium]HOK90262.1 DUF3488 and transglutaminase-like domain-containing protein [Candidatus Hydrogenedentota bacterium]HPO29769.1 DUF3488 and transglutaminase-like domain-containing protein [Candidatus Hydrogenedentota bacterium]
MLDLRQAMRSAIYLALFGGFLALASVRVYGPLMAVVPIVLIALNLLAERWEAYRVFRQFKTVISVLYALFIPLSVVLMGLLQAVISLVIFITCYLLLGRLTVKSCYELLLMAFFLVLGAVVQSPEPLIAVALVVLLLSVVWSFALLTVQADRLAATASRPAVVVDSRSMVINDTWQLWHVLGTLALVSVVALVLGGVLFLFTPRVEAGIFGRADYQRAVTGLTDKVRLDGGMSIYQDTSAVMHVEFPEEPEGVLIPADALYWRVTTLSRFDGAEWSRYQVPAQGREVPIIWPFANGSGLVQIGKAVQRDPVQGRRLVRQEIFVDDVPTGALPVLDLVQYVALEGDERNPRTVQWDPGGDYTVLLNARGPRRLTYQAVSELFQPSPETLATASWTVTDLSETILQVLLYHDLLESTRARIDEVTRNARTPYEVMLTLVNWLNGPDFTYTLDLPPLPPTHPIDAFLTQTRRGHCELFATALALAARYKGIPTRVVNGYRGGDYNPSERAYIVRANMAHLWVEAYFQGVGWVRFDPSPRSDYTATGFAYIRQRWSQQLLLAKMFWYRNVMGFQGGWRLDTLVEQLRQGHGEGRGTGALEVFLEFTSPDRRGRIALPATLVFLVLCAGVVLGLAWRVFWRNQSPYDRVILNLHQRHARWLLRGLRRKLERAGVDTRGLTSEELLTRAASVPALDQEALRWLLAYYEQARFGGGNMTFRDFWRLRGVPILRGAERQHNR